MMSWARQTFEYQVETEARIREAANSVQGKSLLAKVVRLAKQEIGMRDTGGFARHQAYAAIVMVDPEQPETIIGAFNTMAAYTNARNTRELVLERGPICELPEVEILLPLAEVLGLMRVVPGLRFFPHNLDAV